MDFCNRKILWMLFVYESGLECANKKIKNEEEEEEKKGVSSRVC